MTIATTEHPIVEAARRLLHRGDDGGPPIHDNAQGFSAADYSPVRRILWRVDHAGQASPRELALLAHRLRKYRRQLGELGYDAEAMFAETAFAEVQTVAIADANISSAVGYAAADDWDDEPDPEPRQPARPAVPPMADVLGPGGVIAQRLPGYEPRGPQIQLAQAIVDAIGAEESLLAEAGTGTGKSLGYLLPAIYSGRKTVVSTEGKALQDQLTRKDLPFLKAVLPVDFTYAQLKGLSNYLCLQKYDEEVGQQGLFGGSDEWDAVRAWADLLAPESSGDLAEAPLTPSPELLARITSTTDECTGKDCPYHARCYAMRARQAAKNADVLVVNHTLLCLDLAVRAKTDDGVGVLPDRDLVVVDEAHALEEIATKAFTREVSSWTVHALFKGKLPQLAGLDPERQAEAVQASTLFFEDVARLVGQERGAAVVHPTPRLREKAQAVADLLGPMVAKAKAASSDPLRGEGERARLARLADRIEDKANLFATILADVEETFVLYAETEARRQGTSVMLKLAPISVADDLHDALWSKWPVIATSATLSATPTQRGGSVFGYVRERLGLADGRELTVDSPFDFRRNALVYLPEPGFEFDPSRFYQAGSIEYFDRLADQVEQLLLASDGRAFCLFTSRRALDAVYERVAPRLRWNVLKQGEASPNELVRRFKEDGHAVLFGLRTFWAGVDVQGDALSLVIIDKLPFPSPDEPVYQARCDLLNKRTGDRWAWFQRLAIPICSIQYKQGFGRLIRTQTDRGVVALLDGRMTSKAYGASILKALPPAPTTRSLDTVRTFFAQSRAS